MPKYLISRVKLLQTVYSLFFFYHIELQVRLLIYSLAGGIGIGELLCFYVLGLLLGFLFTELGWWGIACFGCLVWGFYILKGGEFWLHSLFWIALLMLLMWDFLVWYCLSIQVLIALYLFFSRVYSFIF